MTTTGIASGGGDGESIAPPPNSFAGIVRHLLLMVLASACYMADHTGAVRFYQSIMT